MKRVRLFSRGLWFALLTAVSSLLMIATAAVWVRSYQAMSSVRAELGRYVFDIDTPTDGICLFVEDDANPASPIYDYPPEPWKGRKGISFDSVAYHTVSVSRPELSEYVLRMRYHPFIDGPTPRGRFSRFMARNTLPDNVHQANFGWGVVLPTWFVVALFAILPSIWLGLRTASLLRARRRGFPVEPIVGNLV